VESAILNGVDVAKVVVALIGMTADADSICIQHDKKSTADK
jgi:hypothetical protein